MRYVAWCRRNCWTTRPASSDECTEPSKLFYFSGLKIHPGQSGVNSSIVLVFLGFLKGFLVGFISGGEKAAFPVIVAVPNTSKNQS